MESQGLTTSSTTKSRHNAFVRFLLKSWQPVPTWQSTIVLFLLVGFALIGFGVALIAINASIVEVKVRYDNDKACIGQATCTITVPVPEAMSPPIFVYYQINNFYQNHRRYINSRSSTQLAGEVPSTDAEKKKVREDCSPVVTNEDMGQTVDLTGQALVATDIAIPCGLIAKSVFTDKYSMFQSDGTTPIPIDPTNIAWPSDRENKFKNPNKDLKGQWANIEDEHFIVWMRTAGLPDFRKLWGKLDRVEDLPAGEYKVTVTNSYSVDEFEGEKWLVLSTTGAFGGKNNFLAISYLAVGGVCIVVAIFFFIRWRQYSKKNL